MFFPFITLSISCHSLLACRVFVERLTVILMGVSLHVVCCFSLAAFNIFSLYLILLVWLICILACSPWVCTVWDSLGFLDFGGYFHPHFRKVFNYYSNIFSCPFFLSYSSGTPLIQMLVHLILSHRSLKLSSVLFILFTLFCSSEVISTILSSSSPICSSASYILLLIPSRVFLISVIVLFVSVCLFFNSSRSLLTILAFSALCF